MPDDPLALETRRKLYEEVRRTPGLGAREAQRAAGTGWGETVYHLDRLVDSGLVHREPGSGQDHYFVAQVPLADRRLLRLCRSASARRILVSLLELREPTVPEIRERAGLSDGRLSVHLRRFLRDGMVVSGRRGRLRTFRVVDPDRVVALLITYRDGLADQWVERLLETWGELFRS